MSALTRLAVVVQRVMPQRPGPGQEYDRTSENRAAGPQSTSRSPPGSADAISPDVKRLPRAAATPFTTQAPSGDDSGFRLLASAVLKDKTHEPQGQGHHDCLHTCSKTDINRIA